MNISYNTILNWAFLGISVICILVFTPMSLTHDKQIVYDDPNPIIDVDFPNKSIYILERFIKLVDNSSSTIDIMIAYPIANSENISIFNQAIERAISRGVKVRMYTQNQSITVPKGVEIRYWNDKTKDFCVNIAIIDSKTIFYPSTFIPPDVFMNDNYVLGYYSIIQGKNAVISAQMIFDYIWNMPANGYVAISWKFLTQQPKTTKFDFTFDPQIETKVNRPTIASAVRSVLDQSAEQKIIVSNSYFPDKYKNYMDGLKYASATTLLELQGVADILVDFFVSEAEFYKHESNYRSISYIYNASENFNFKMCYLNRVFDGTVIVANDEYVLAPAPYHKLFDSNTVIVGLYQKVDKFNLLRERINKFNCKKM